MKSMAKLPMKLKIDNKGAVDFADNWTIGGCVRHVDVHLHFLRELKKQRIIDTEWISNTEMSSDIFTKNVSGPEFLKHASKFVSDQLTLKGRVLETKFAFVFKVIRVRVNVTVTF